VLEPSSTVLHYAQTIFEGMKAYHDAEGRVRLFRPDMNMKRMNTSANRIALPVCTFVFGTYNALLRPLIPKSQTFDGAALLELIKELVRLDKHWIPKETGHSLYIRPTLSKLSQRQLLAFLLIHTSPCSWYSTRHWGQPTQRSSPLRHPQSRRTILPQRIQARGALWHN